MKVNGELAELSKQVEEMASSIIFAGKKAN